MTDKKKVVVLGAGIGGLSAGYFLARTGNYDVTVLEKAPVIGGLCASFEMNDFTLDYGAHKLYSVIPGVLDEITDLMGDRLLTLPKKNRLFLRGQLVDYPLKLGNIASVLGPVTFLQLGFGYGIELLRGLFNHSEPGSYEDYIIRRFGRPTYELVFEPLADKVWGDPATLHPEMARTRVPASGGLEVVLKLLGLKKETAETNAEFFYYPEKGFGDYPATMHEHIKRHGGRVLTGVDVTGFQMDGMHISSVQATIDGKQQTLPVDHVVSSIPLPLVGRMVFGADDHTFTQAAGGLQFRHLVLVYVWVERDMVLEDQWIFFPERKLVFSRIFEQKQMNPALGPKGMSVITADFTADEGSELWASSDDQLSARVVDGLVEAGFVQRDEVRDTYVFRHKNFYPRYDLSYADKMKTVSDKLRGVDNLLTTGRIGMYNYNNSDHCTDMGRFIAQGLEAGQPAPEIWAALEQRVADYKIVD
jgi:protoporphyrinogen oxidase